MAVSKRLRYEILRRDNHACRYCGATAPDTPLTVDHVVPTALGGTDEASNLVTACRDCNSGKSATAPDTPLVADVEADALRWSRAMVRAADALLADLKQRETRYDEFAERWNEWTTEHGPIELPGDWKPTLDRFLTAGLPMPVLLEAVDIAMAAKKLRTDRVFRYFCGVAWNRVADLQSHARELATTDERETRAPQPCGLTVADGTVCESPPTHRVQLLHCTICPGSSCAGHDICEPHMRWARKHGLRGDGDVTCIVIYIETLTAVSA